MDRSQTERERGAGTFADWDVARCYRARPPYPAAVFETLLGEVAGRERALDLGCGPGNIAIPLADHFRQVVALDPSEPMLSVAREADARRRPNIAWTLGRAETYDDARGFDVVTAGASIHWPDHARLFPKLARWTGTLAIIVGDAPTSHPCGDDAWAAFMTSWLARVGEVTNGLVRPYDRAGMVREMRRHEAWMDIAGRQTFPFIFRQSIDDFVTCQHSRATWARAVMGEALAADFDDELRALMAPFAVDGLLELQMETELTWGAPRPTPKA